MAMPAIVAATGTAWVTAGLREWGTDIVAATTERTRWLRAAMLALCGAVGAGTAIAGERTVYRSEMPGGRVLYSDAPAAGAGRVQRMMVEPHPADPQQALAAQRVLASWREALQREGRLRSERLAQIDAEARGVREELQRAAAGRAAAQDVQAGDRQGRRLTPTYWQRQQRAADAEARAQLRLDELTRERAIRERLAVPPCLPRIGT